MTLPDDVAARPLVPLPGQPDGVPWPTEEWPAGEEPTGGAPTPLLDAVMDPHSGHGRTRAVVVVHRGQLVAERYGDRTDARGEVTGGPVDASTPLLSWSMAKSMLHAIVGMLVDEGRLRLDDPAPVPTWDEGDPRAAITLEHLLAMRDGLDFAEDYAPDDECGSGVSHVIEMLFGSGAADVARFGQLYLRHGVWDGTRLLPEGWVDHGRRPRSVDPVDGHLYGAQWWATTSAPSGPTATRGSRSWCARDWTSWSCGSGSPPSSATPPSRRGGPRWWTRSAEEPAVRGAGPNRPDRGNRPAGSCRRDRPAGRCRGCSTFGPGRP
jgi:CubicO group peptidase (beta-lactamase class C family)